MAPGRRRRHGEGSTLTRITLAEAKAQAKALRVALLAKGTTISHARALELVARQQGARDWNTLHARLDRRDPPPKCPAREDRKAPPLALAAGVRVGGLCLGQVFTGRVITLEGPEDGRRIEIRLDQPVDTVRFESFSNLRRQIRATVDRTGRSPHTTSDGRPHLVIRSVVS